MAEYNKRDALSVVRLIADNVGGITGSMRIGLLADAFGMIWAAHNCGNVLNLGLHSQVEPALPNAIWFDMPYPAEYIDPPFTKHKFKIDADGFVAAPTEPGLGYCIDRMRLTM